VLLAGSSLLAAVTLASMWLIGRKSPAGWLVAIGAQLLWLPYDVATGQLGFITITAASVPVYVRGWRRFRADRRVTLDA
jgi:hypothetical protein